LFLSGETNDNPMEFCDSMRLLGSNRLIDEE
jgi:hypothetical protein